jgi:hypothetical protein
MGPPSPTAELFSDSARGSGGVARSASRDAADLGNADFKMQPLRTNRELLVGLAQSTRAALVVPSLFAMALLVIKQPEIAGFAVLGTFAHLAMVDYDATGSARLIQSATLTVFGSIMVTIGALASSNVWLAVSRLLQLAS